MTFCDLTIYNDNPLLIRLCTELDLLPNFEWFPLNICDGCGMPTGDAYSSGHLVPSLWDLHMFYLLRPILFRTCRYFTGLCSSNIPRYFHDFPYKGRGPTSHLSGEAMKIITQTCKVIKTVYEKYVKTSARIGYSPPVQKRAQAQGLKQS